MVRRTPRLSESDARVDVLLQMRRLLTVIAESDKVDLSDEKSRDLNNARNEVQYHILTLPDSTFRIAALLLSDMLIFKSPVTTGIGDKLTHSLRRRLQSSNHTGPLSIWMATVGGLATEVHSLANDYFMNFAANQALKLGITDLGAFRSELSQVIWHDHLFQPELERIWSRLDQCLPGLASKADLVALFVGDEVG